MTIILTNGNRYSAYFIAQGKEKWGEGGPDGLSLYCTDAILWFPLSEIAEIEMDKYVIYRKVAS